MHGISIRYAYSGDEKIWERTILEFIQNIDNDSELHGKFTYRVNISKDGKSRVHWGKWEDQNTVETLQSRDFFKKFAAQLKDMAGDTLNAVPLTSFAETSK